MTVRPQESHWIPLLVLNGVSSATGRRILTTVLSNDYQPKNTCPVAGAMKSDADIKSNAAPTLKSAVSSPIRACAIFLESARFHDLLANDNPPNLLARIQRLAVWDYVRNQLPFFTPRELDDIRLSTAAHNSASRSFLPRAKSVIASTRLSIALSTAAISRITARSVPWNWCRPFAPLSRSLLHSCW